MVQSVIWEEGEDESRKKQWPCAKGGGGGSKQKEEILLQSAPAPTQQYSGTQYRGKRRKVDICGIVLLPPISVSNQHTVQLSWGKYKYKQVQVQYTVQTAQVWQVQAQVQ